MKIALLGLAANPPHNGHLGLAEVVAPYVDEVWLLPCYKHMYGKVLESPEHRLKMCKLLTGGRPKLWTCDWEIKNKSSGRAIETVEGIRRAYAYGEYDFHWVIGSDNALTIGKWYKGSDLIRTVPFLVVHRKGYTLIPGWYDEAPHRVIQTDWENPTSSTEIREGLLAGKPVDEPPDILSYIKEHHLYEGHDNREGG